MQTGVETALLQIFIIFLFAKIAGEMFKLVKQPEVVGELVVGILLGQSVLGIIGSSEVFDVLAQIGVIVLLFSVGLETRIGDLKKVGITASLVAVSGIVLPFALGYALILLMGGTAIEAMFVGAALIATSIGITARVLLDMDIIGSKEAKIILGAAIIDDILGLIILTLVSGLATGSFSLMNTSIVIVETLLFVGILIVLGTRVVDKVSGLKTVEQKKVFGPVKSRWALRYRTFYKKHDLLGKAYSKWGLIVVPLLVCFGLSALTAYVGLAAIIGAFFAGILFAGRKMSKPMEQKMEPMRAFFFPFFFVIMGTKVVVDFSFVPYIPLTIVLIVFAILGKLIACGIGAAHHGKRSAIMVGAGMVPRGEVGIIVAMVGLQMGIITEGLFSVIVIMSIVTTLWAPTLLKISSKIDEKEPFFNPLLIFRKNSGRSNG